MLTRRRLVTISVQLALAGSCLAVLPGCDESASTDVQIENSPLVEFLLGYSSVSYAGPKCAETLGFQPQSDVLNLQQNLSDALENKLATLAGDLNIEQGLAQLTRIDFENNRILDIDGWQLGRTECQAAALAASLHGFTEPVEVALTPPAEVNFVTIEAWGPDHTLQGEAFNQQPDGHSGIWFKAKDIPPSTIMIFSGLPQESNVYADHMTSGLRGKLMHATIDKPGKYSVDIYDRSRHRIQHIGEFEVVERLGPVPLDKCQVASWGPNQAVSGQMFNAQAGGASAFWIRTNCNDPKTIVVFDGRDLHTAVRPTEGLITASMNDGHELPPGQYKVGLRLDNVDFVLPVGTLNVIESAPVPSPDS